ncbi:MAG: glycosyltransferase family A protein [Candidatus Bathyarchaeia archaeon]
MKVDLVMWTLNGEKTLPLVLSRINEIIPKDIVNQRLIVDDGSKDNTVTVARKYGWNVIKNEGKGISDAANTALKHIQTSYFCSFEQDVFLSSNWWNKVSALILNKEGVGAACGLRFLPRNNFCFSVEPYQLTRKDIDFYGGYGKTLDNTIWNTEALRSIGGFPKVNFAGIDTFVFHLLDSKGYKWLVDYNVKSLHLHYGGLLNEFKHYYFYGSSLPQIYSRLKSLSLYENENLSSLLLRFAKSPISSFKMALRMHDSRLMLSYPIIRLCWLLGYIHGTSSKKISQ